MKAKQAAEALFGNGATAADMPSTDITLAEFGEGMTILDLLLKSSLIPSKAEGRRLIEQGGISVNDVKVEAIDLILTKNDFTDGALMIKKGKKVYHRVNLI